MILSRICIPSMVLTQLILLLIATQRNLSHAKTESIYKCISNKELADVQFDADHRVSFETFCDLKRRVIAHRNVDQKLCFVQKMHLPSNPSSASTKSRCLTENQLKVLAGDLILEFCRGYTALFVGSAGSAINPNSGQISSEVLESAVDNNLPTRAKRNSGQSSNGAYTAPLRGRYRGQTQSQYLNFNGNSTPPGRAEAESSPTGSRAVVSGKSGMGQAQSQSGFSSGCEDCIDQSQYGRDYYSGGKPRTSVYGPGVSESGNIYPDGGHGRGDDNFAGKFKTDPDQRNFDDRSRTFLGYTPTGTQVFSKYPSQSEYPGTISKYVTTGDAGQPQGIYDASGRLSPNVNQGYLPGDTSGIRKDTNYQPYPKQEYISSYPGSISAQDGRPGYENFNKYPAVSDSRFRQPGLGGSSQTDQGNQYRERTQPTVDSRGIGQPGREIYTQQRPDGFPGSSSGPHITTDYKTPGSGATYKYPISPESQPGINREGSVRGPEKVSDNGIPTSHFGPNLYQEPANRISGRVPDTAFTTYYRTPGKTDGDTEYRNVYQPSTYDGNQENYRPGSNVDIKGPPRTYHEGVGQGPVSIPGNQNVAGIYQSTPGINQNGQRIHYQPAPQNSYQLSPEAQTSRGFSQNIPNVNLLPGSYDGTRYQLATNQDRPNVQYVTQGVTGGERIPGVQTPTTFVTQNIPGGFQETSYPQRVTGGERLSGGQSPTNIVAQNIPGRFQETSHPQGVTGGERFPGVQSPTNFIAQNIPGRFQETSHPQGVTGGERFPGVQSPTNFIAQNIPGRFQETSLPQGVTGGERFPEVQSPGTFIASNIPGGFQDTSHPQGAYQGKPDIHISTAIPSNVNVVHPKPNAIRPGVPGAYGVSNNQDQTKRTQVDSSNNGNLVPSNQMLPQTHQIYQELPRTGSGQVVTQNFQKTPETHLGADKQPIYGYTPDYSGRQGVPQNSNGYYQTGQTDPSVYQREPSVQIQGSYQPYQNVAYHGITAQNGGEGSSFIYPARNQLIPESQGSGRVSSPTHQTGNQFTTTGGDNRGLPPSSTGNQIIDGVQDVRQVPPTVYRNQGVQLINGSPNGYKPLETSRQGTVPNIPYGNQIPTGGTGSGIQTPSTEYIANIPGQRPSESDTKYYPYRVDTNYYPQGVQTSTGIIPSSISPVYDRTVDPQTQGLNNQGVGSQNTISPSLSSSNTSQQWQQQQGNIQYTSYSPVTEEDGVDRTSEDQSSQAEASIKHLENGTHASSSSSGVYAGGTAQTQISGTYSGSGSFSAQAQTIEANRGSQSQITAGKNGISSSAQGRGGRGQSQAQLQLDSEVGETIAEAQSSGINHGTNTQVKASSTGGLADAQASGPGSTSSQAQIGFKPQGENNENVSKGTVFNGGGTASAQSGKYDGQSQTQIQGRFKYGITYTGAAQAGSGLKDRGTRNRTTIKPLNLFENSNLRIDRDAASKTKNVNSTAHSKEVFEESESNFYDNILPVQEISKIRSKDSMTTTNNAIRDTQSFSMNQKQSSSVKGDMSDNYEKGIKDFANAEDYDESEEDDYDGEFNQSKEATHQELNQRREVVIQQNGNGQKQHILFNSMDKNGIHIVRDSSSKDILKEGMVFQPGEEIPGTLGYTIPIGFRGRVSSVAAGDDTFAFADENGESQAQTITLTPGNGNITYGKPIYKNQQSVKSGASTRTRQPTKSNSDILKTITKTENPDSFITVTKSVAGELNKDKTDLLEDKKFTHTYFTKSSTCGYFTFTCNLVNGSNGRTKICKPRAPTNPDGSPITC